MKKLSGILTAVAISGVIAAAIPCLSGCGGDDESDESVSGLIKLLGSDDEDTYLRARLALENIKSPVPRSTPAPHDLERGDHEGHQH